MATDPADPLSELHDTHTHEVRTQPLVKGLVVAMVLMALALGSILYYLNERRIAADQRNERERVAICAILNQIPNEGHPSIVQAKVAFACR